MCNILRKSLICAILMVTLLSVVYAAETIKEAEDHVTSASGRQEALTNSQDLARRRKNRFGYSHLFPLLGIGGVHAISTLVAIKFKLVLIFIAVMGTIFYGYKIYAGSSCGVGAIYHDTPSSSIGATLPFDSGYHSSGPVYSSYPGGPDPYSAYNPDISAAPPSGAEVSHSGPYRRAAQARSMDGGATRNKRQSDPGYHFGEILFSVLGVDSEQCRMRFVCEMSVNYRRNPLFGPAYTMISRQFFPKYTRAVDAQGAVSMRQCAKQYQECRGPSDPPIESEEDVEVATNALTPDATEGSGDDHQNETRHMKSAVGVPTVIMARSIAATN